MLLFKIKDHILLPDVKVSIEARWRLMIRNFNGNYSAFLNRYFSGSSFLTKTLNISVKNKATKKYPFKKRNNIH